MPVSYVLDRVADGRFQIQEVGGALAWPPPPGDALPAFPDVTSARGSQQAWASAPYATTLPARPPELDAYEYRGDFCGIDIPDAPVVYGGNGDNARCIMAMLTPNYPDDFQPRIWETYGRRGLREFQTSIWHFRYLHPTSGVLSVKKVGSGRTAAAEAEHVGRLLWHQRFTDRSVEGVRAALTPAAGTLATARTMSALARPAGLTTSDRTLDHLIAYLRRVKASGLRNDVWLTANDVPDGGRAYYEPELDAWIKAMIAEQVIDTACVGWQLDRSNSPRSLQEIIEYFSALLAPAGVPLYCHWINDACAWWDSDGMSDAERIGAMPGPEHQGIVNRFAWHGLNRRYLRGNHIQIDTGAPVDAVQDDFGKVLETTDATAFETSGQERFDGSIDEAHARMKTRALMATPARAFRLIGYGNNGGQVSPPDPVPGGAL